MPVEIYMRENLRIIFNVQTGQQQVIVPFNANLPHHVQLLGWDVMPFCNIGC